MPAKKSSIGFSANLGPPAKYPLPMLRTLSPTWLSTRSSTLPLTLLYCLSVKLSNTLWALSSLESNPMLGSRKSFIVMRPGGLLYPDGSSAASASCCVSVAAESGSKLVGSVPFGEPGDLGSAADGPFGARPGVWRSEITMAVEPGVSPLDGGEGSVTRPDSAMGRSQTLRTCSV